PDESINTRSWYLARMARLSATSIRQHIHPTAAVIRVSPIVPHVHRQTAPAAAEQTAQEILTARVARRPLLVPLQPCLRQRKPSLVNQRRHRNPDPLLPRAKSTRFAALATRFSPQKRVTSFGRHCLLLITVRNSSVCRVHQDLPHAGWIPIGPTAWRGNTTVDQALRDSV